MGRTRVTPVKPIITPKLEWAAGVVSVNLAQALRRELGVEIESVFFWTDSAAALQYVRSTARRFQVFIANRIAAIQTGSDPSQWCYNDSSSNPADAFSHGVIPDQVEAVDLWLKIPEVLLFDQPQWHSFPSDIAVGRSDPKLKKSANAMALNVGTEFQLYRFLSYYSDWLRLRSAVAWMMRRKSYLMWKYKGVDALKPSYSSLAVDEIDFSALEFLKLV